MDDNGKNKIKYYKIKTKQSQCNATISLKQFFDMVYEEPKKMLLYGDACRVSTDPIAKASYFFDLIQVSEADYPFGAANSKQWALLISSMLAYYSAPSLRWLWAPN